MSCGLKKNAQRPHEVHISNRKRRLFPVVGRLFAVFGYFERKQVTSMSPVHISLKFDDGTKANQRCSLEKQ